MGHADEKDGNWISRMLPPAFLFLALSLPPKPLFLPPTPTPTATPARCSRTSSLLVSSSPWQLLAVLCCHLTPSPPCCYHPILHRSLSLSLPSKISRVPVTRLHAHVSLSYPGVTAGQPPQPPPPRIRRRFRSGTIRFIVSYNTVIKVVYSHGKSNHGDDQRRAGSPAHPLTTVRTEAVWLPSKLQR